MPGELRGSPWGGVFGLCVNEAPPPPPAHILLIILLIVTAR